jgi:repressor LexA
MQLTARQAQILDFILDFRRDNGCSPSIPEIQQHFGIRSPNGVACHLDALVTKGYIQRAHRGSRLVDPLPRALMRMPGLPPGLHALPIFGQIPAGPPQEMSAYSDGAATFDEHTLGFRPAEGCFMLKVRGDSMRDAGILNGDMVVIQPTPTPRPGQIVAASRAAGSSRPKTRTIPPSTPAPISSSRASSAPSSAASTDAAQNTPRYSCFMQRDDHPTTPPVSPTQPDTGADEPMLYCPVCSTRLHPRKCKLICEQCGYYMSCADYY